MNQQEQILSAFLAEQLPDFDVSSKEGKQILLLLSETLSLAQQDANEGYRTVTIKEDSDGKITAHSIKLFNILQADLDKQIKLLSRAIAIFPIALALQFTAGFLAILAYFIPMLKVEFNEQDAKVLLAIYKLHSKTFSTDTVNKELQNIDFESLTQKKLHASLVKLANAKVIRSLGHGKYLRMEKLKYKR